MSYTNADIIQAIKSYQDRLMRYLNNRNDEKVDIFTICFTNV